MAIDLLYNLIVAFGFGVAYLENRSLFLCRNLYKIYLEVSEVVSCVNTLCEWFVDQTMMP